MMAARLAALNNDSLMGSIIPKCFISWLGCSDMAPGSRGRGRTREREEIEERIEREEIEERMEREERERELGAMWLLAWSVWYWWAPASHP